MRQTSDECESIREADDHEELTKRTREVLQRHRGEAPIARFCELAPYYDGVAIGSGKRGRSPLPISTPNCHARRRSNVVDLYRSWCRISWIGR